MELVYQRCCGIDIHKKVIVACLIVLAANGQRHKEIRTFRTVTGELLQLLDWLKAAECTHVAMESTGVYWKSIYNLLEGYFELLVANAQHIKAVPGRKTDVRDAEWIADLLQHGLLRGSYIPSAPQRELRELTRYRTNLVEERARAVNRLQKTLEDTNRHRWEMWRPISWGSPRELCWRRCLPDKPIRRYSLTWRAGASKQNVPS